MLVDQSSGLQQMQQQVDLVRAELFGTPLGATSTPAPPTSGTVADITKEVIAHFDEIVAQVRQRQTEVLCELNEIAHEKDAALKQQRDACGQLLTHNRAVAGEVQRDLEAMPASWVVSNEKRVVEMLTALTSAPPRVLDGVATDSRLEYQRSASDGSSSSKSQGDAGTSKGGGASAVDATGSLSPSLLGVLGRIVTTDVQAEDWCAASPGPPDRCLGSELVLTVRPRDHSEEGRRAVRAAEGG